jgi:hypothetical protein
MNFAAADTFKSSISLYEFWRIFLPAVPVTVWGFFADSEI